MSDSQLRIMLVDDHYLVRVGLTSVISLEPDMTVCAEAATGEQAIAGFRAHRPDVTLMGVRLPGMSGLEALTNALKHGKPTRIDIELWFRPTSVALAIQDDGHGLREAAEISASHFGLQGIRERVNKLGGRLDIHGRPGEGTRIVVTVPIGARRAAAAPGRAARGRPWTLREFGFRLSALGSRVAGFWGTRARIADTRQPGAESLEPRV